MSLIKKEKVFDPELEELRLKALNFSSEENINQDVENVIQATRRIHAAFLFLSPKTLQPLIRAIGESNNTALDSGWQMLGDKLGLHVSILKVINNNQFNKEDPVYNTLLHYVQYGDATIGKIVQALADMGRFDVITRTKDVLLQLAEVILNHERDLMRSSHPMSDYGSMESNLTSGSEVEISHDILIKPPMTPNAPFIFKDVQATPLLSTLLLEGVASSRTNVICSPTFSQALELHSYQNTSPVPSTSSHAETSLTSNEPRPNPKLPNQSFQKKVMLTFAEDGSEVAAEVARILRQQRGSSRIGVLILSEQLRHLQNDPNLFISAAVQLVDYVIPILTEKYLQTVLRKSFQEPSSCVDATYVPFIYQTMVQDYLRKGCLNDKVRCLIPDDQLKKVLSHLMMAGPLFAAWERTSCTDRLAERILASNV